MEALKKAFSSGQFLAATILATCSVGTSLIFSASFDIIGILLVIGMWLTWNAARCGEVKCRFLRGVAKAKVILTWVAIGFLALGAILLFVCSAFVGYVTDAVVDDGLPGAVDELKFTGVSDERANAILGQFNELVNEDHSDLDIDLHMENGRLYINDRRIDSSLIKDIFDDDDARTALALIFTFIFVAFGIGMIIAAVIALVINLAYNRKLYGFLDGASGGSLNVKMLKGLRGWFMFFAVIKIISALGGILIGSLSSACDAAMYIILFIIAGNVLNAQKAQIPPEAPAMEYPQDNV